ncbi:hypothetical protein [Burkholderia multivorans]|uniref:hypothetical protein n=1 Tax=Burkholderia multivorans TaxID=87883 RepID=UPI00054E9C1F|nr:hypothetical protein [Burkholderia multivorans]
MAIDTENMKALAAKAREESVALMNSFSEDVFGTLYEAADAIDTLLAALEAAASDKRDAERYRWISRAVMPFQNYASGNPNWTFAWYGPRGPTFDEAIDAALSQRQEES